MIARSLLMFLLLVVLPDVYIDYHYLRRKGVTVWQRCLWWLPTLVMEFYTIALAMQSSFIPRQRLWVDVYLWILCLIVIPKAVFVLSSLSGSLLVKICHTQRNYGHFAGILLGLVIAGMSVYGFTAGFNQMTVRHIEVSLDDLPEGFDGYRIAHVSDLHVGSYEGWRRHTLETIIDSVRLARPDMVCFTGDLQNVRPEEILQVKELLRRLPRTFAVLGNHDYSDYAGGTSDECEAIERQLMNIERRQLGWTLLNNEHRMVKAPNGDSIFIVGTENDGRPPFPTKADYTKAYKGIPDKAFVLMLQHDPSAWRRNILTYRHPASLTLSGHTHGGQVGLGGLRPTRFNYAEDSGLYEEDGRMLYVSNGAGGLIPFRLGVPNEVTIITLRAKKTSSFI